MFSATGTAQPTISYSGPTNIPRCHHIRVDGVQCGSPALKGKRLCYFHSRARVTRSSTNLPILEDSNSVQHALMQVITALIRGTVDREIAGLLLYALQTASANARRVDFAPLPYYVVRDLTGAVPHNEDEPLQSDSNADVRGPDSAVEPAAASDAEPAAALQPDPLRAALKLARDYVLHSGATLRPSPPLSRKKRPRSEPEPKPAEPASG